MQPGEHGRMRRVEDQHWWFQVLRGLVRRDLRLHVPAGSRVLDVGCGTGGMLALLSDWDAHGIDLSPDAVQLCRERGLTQVRLGTVHDLPFASASFAAVLCLDVLYHRDVEENRAMEEMTRVLRPGGLLLLNLPAFDCLRGSHDCAVGGARRYSPCNVRGLLKSHSLNIEMMHCWNAWLFVPMLAWRLLSRLRAEGAARSDLALPPGWLNDLLALAGTLEARLCRSLRVPAGSSVFAAARKPGLCGKGAVHA